MKNEEQVCHKLHVDTMTWGENIVSEIAHEINNPLTSILSTLEFLLEDMSNECNYCKKDIVQVIKEAKRIKETIKIFLNFVKQGDFVLKDTNVNNLIGKALKVVDSENLSKFKIIKNFDKSVRAIKLMRPQIEEVFINIITNAMKSMGDNGTLTITTRRTKNEIVASFSDTGVGIKKENLKKMLDPFFTTKEKFSPGLGFTKSVILISQHGGKIEVKSKGRDSGAEFIVRFPK